jgi:hypothetical protein
VRACELSARSTWPSLSDHLEGKWVLCNLCAHCMASKVVNKQRIEWKPDELCQCSYWVDWASEFNYECCFMRILLDLLMPWEISSILWNLWKNSRENFSLEVDHRADNLVHAVHIIIASYNLLQYLFRRNPMEQKGLINFQLWVFVFSVSLCAPKKTMQEKVLLVGLWTYWLVVFSVVVTRKCTCESFWKKHVDWTPSI